MILFYEQRRQSAYPQGTTHFSVINQEGFKEVV